MADGLLTVVCTDRGQHKRRRLYVGTDDGVPGLRVPDHLESWRRDGGMQFRCPSCGRNPQFTAATWQLLVEGLAAVGESILDISHLPM